MAARGQFLQKQNGLYLHVYHDLYRSLLLPVHENQPGHFPNSQFKLFSVSLNFDTI